MALAVNQSQRFNYTGGTQSITLKSGKYKIQCYGARGGGSGAAGGYSEGIIEFDKTTTLTVYCGGTPSGQSGGYGYSSGSSGQSGGGKYSYGGGGGSAVLMSSTILLRAAGGKGTDNSYQTSAQVPKGMTTSGSIARSGGSTTIYSFTAASSGTASVSINFTGWSGDKYFYNPDNLYVYKNGTLVSDIKYGRSASVSCAVGDSIRFVHYCYSSQRCTLNYTVTYPGSETVYTTHNLTGGSGGGATSVSSLMTNASTSGSNTGNGYIIITCQVIHSLIINCKNCTIDGYSSMEIITAKTYSIKALHSMIINGIPSILDNVSIPNGLTGYVNIVDLRFVELIVNATLLSKGAEYTIEAFYHENIRLNSDLYKNSTDDNVSDFLKILGEIINDQ